MYRTPPTAEILQTEVAARSGFATLRRCLVRYVRADGREQVLTREVYDHGDGAAALLWDRRADLVLLVRQWRFGAFVTGDPAGALLVEAPAGLLDGRDPETAVAAELMEETGAVALNLERVTECYVSPGSLSERITLFVGGYDSGARRGAGGGLVAEGEDIEVIEPSLAEAWAMVGRGEIRDAKTIILLQTLRERAGRDQSGSSET